MEKFESRVTAYLGARFLGLLADSYLLFIVPLYIYKETSSVLMSGASLFAQWAPRIILLPWATKLIDKFDQKGCLYALSDTARIAACLLLLVSPNLYASMVIIGALSLLNAVSYVLFEQILSSVKSNLDITLTQSKAQLNENISRLLGPLLASMMLDFTSFEQSIYPMVVLFVLSIIFVWPYTFIEYTTQNKNQPTIGKQPFIFLIKHERLLRSTGYAMTSNFLRGVITAISPHMVLTEYGYSGAHLSYLYSISLFATLLLLRVAPNCRLGQSKRLGEWSISIALMSALLMCMLSSFWIYSLFFIIFGLAESLFILHLRRERTELVPTTLMSVFLGVQLPLMLLPIPLSGVVVALTSPEIDPAQLLIAVSLIIILFYILIRLSRKRLKRKWHVKNIGKHISK